MQLFLPLSRWIDALNYRFGRLANLMILLSCVISATNALLRYGFDQSNNSMLEIQWYLFAGAVMLGASYTFQRNEHVRVDLIYGHVSDRVKRLIDVFGIVVFLLPACILFAWLSWTALFLPSWHVLEQSSNAGGLARYPVKFVVPLGFLLISLQGISELIKRIAAMSGKIELDTKYERPVQ